MYQSLFSLIYYLPQADNALFHQRYPQHSNIHLSVLPQRHVVHLLIGNDQMWLFANKVEHLKYPESLPHTAFGHMWIGLLENNFDNYNFVPLFFTNPQNIENL